MGGGVSKEVVIVEPRPDDKLRKEQQQDNKQTYLGIKSPRLPTKSKEQIIKLAHFQHLDKHAEQVPVNLLTQDYQLLALHLTKNANTELEKVRVLFHWLTSVNIHDLEVALGGDLPNHRSPMKGLLEIQWQISNHAHIFARLARSAGLKCEVITGITKNASYSVGHKIDKQAMSAQWNAVEIEGDCYLLDAFWASTCVENNSNSDGSYLWNLFSKENAEKEDEEKEKKLKEKRVNISNEFYFLTDPPKMIYTHLPNDSKWQLLEKPITLQEFEKGPCFFDKFYKLGLVPENKCLEYCVLKTKEGKCDINFVVPDGCARYLNFRWNITGHSTSKNQPTLNKDSYERYVFFYKENNKVSFTIELPAEGRYQFDLFAQNTDSEGADECYGKVCSYLIVCPQGKENIELLPDLPDNGWGTCPSASQHQLVPQFQDTPTIVTNNGALKLLFAVPQEKYISAVLRHNTLNDMVLKKQTMLFRNGNNCQIYLRLPEKGNYALKIYIKDPAVKKSVNICNYLVRVLQCIAVDVLDYPGIYAGKVGKGDHASNVGLSVEPSSEKFFIETKDGKVKIEIILQENIDEPELLCELQHNDLDAEALSNNIKVTRNDDLVTFYFALPKAGEYAFNVFAKKSNNKHQILHLYSYFITSSSESKASLEHAKVVTSKETIFTTDSKASIWLPSDDFCVLAVSHEYLPDQNLEIQVSASKDKELTEYDLTLPVTGEYCVSVYSSKNHCLVLQQQLKVVRLEPLVSATAPKRSVTSSFISIKDSPRKTKASELEQEVLRLQLKAAVMSENMSLLQWAIEQYELAFIDDKHGELKNCKKILEFMKISHEISNALQIRHYDRLKNAIEAAKRENLESVLYVKIAIANQILEKLKNLEDLKENIEQLDRKVIAEIQSFKRPPEIVHTVMRATCDLLGMDTHKIQEWSELQVILGQQGRTSLKRLILQCDLHSVDIMAAMRAKIALEHFTLAEVRAKSSGAAVFYLWSTNVIEEVETRFVQKGGDVGRVRALVARNNNKMLKTVNTLLAMNGLKAH